jgi:hypothetical protein
MQEVQPLDWWKAGMQGVKLLDWVLGLRPSFPPLSAAVGGLTNELCQSNTL